MPNDRPPYFYPEYIKEMLHRLMECSLSDKYPLLYDKAGLISVLYNQFNDFPVTEQVYSLVWDWANRMIETNNTNWMREYWSHANQYYTFKLDYSRNVEAKYRFREFHVMVGAMLTYKRQFEQLKFIMEFTNAWPPKYPLIPSTFSIILGVYEELSRKNQEMYLIQYRMIGMYTGAGEERRIEGALIDYLSLLLIRLVKVNDYNITFSDPLSLPLVGNTVEENERKIMVIDMFIRRIEQWRSGLKNLKVCGLSLNGIALALATLKRYRETCRNKQLEIPEHPVVSDTKRNKLRDDLVSALQTCILYLPFNGLAEEGKPYVSSQEIKLNKEQILEGYDGIASNLGEAMVNAIYIQVRQFYCFQFLLNSPCVSYTVPYRDMGIAMKRLSLNGSFAILALGISSHFFDETEGFCRTKDNSVKYDSTDVVNIPANNECLLIMKKEDVPQVVVRQIGEGRQKSHPDELEIDKSMRLYSNIDSLTPENLSLTASISFGVIMKDKLKYIRVRIAYELTSDEMLLRKIGPVSKYIV